MVHGAEVTAEHLIEAAHHGNHHLLRVLLTCHEQVKTERSGIMGRWPFV